MKVVLWVGNEPNQKGLAHKIAAVTNVVGIVTETRKIKRKLTFGLLIKKATGRILFSSISRAWTGMKLFFENKYPQFPVVPLLNTENINSDEVFEFTSHLQPDLIVVSGTSLVKKKLLSINPSIGIMNLHTGVSPYIKGGPNCTNWCLATAQLHLIGNTVMWIDAGVDTGKIIATELTALTGDESLTDLHIKVMEHAHDLYVRSIKKIEKEKIPGVRQSDIAEGKTYYTKDWGLPEQINLLKNFRKFKEIKASPEYSTGKASVKLIEL